MAGSSWKQPIGRRRIRSVSISRSEALEEAIVADVTAKLARSEEWHEVA